MLILLSIFCLTIITIAMIILLNLSLKSKKRIKNRDPLTGFSQELIDEYDSKWNIFKHKRKMNALEIFIKELDIKDKRPINISSDLNNNRYSFVMNDMCDNKDELNNQLSRDQIYRVIYNSITFEIFIDKNDKFIKTLQKSN